MHILFIVTRGDSIGGAQIHVRDTAKALKSDGHQVTVLTGAAGDMTDQLDAAGVSWALVPSLVRPIRPFKDLKAIFQAAGHIRRRKPDLVSCHTAKAGMVGRIAAVLGGAASIFTAHGWQFADGIPAGQAKAVLAIEKMVAPLCRKVITVSNYDFQLALRKKAVKAEKMVTIHNGLPWMEAVDHEAAADKATEHKRAEHEAPGKEVAGYKAEEYSEKTNEKAGVRLLMVARFQEQKDHTSLLKALARLQDLSWTLELVGDGPGMPAAQQLALELGIEDRIDFAGQQMDVPQRMERADIYLLISNWEGFPRSIIEAMRAGLPVVASDVGGCNESVDDSKTGFLVPQGDVERLREKLALLISRPELRRELGAAGRRRYEAEFTFQHMYRRTLELYREVIR